MVLIGSDGSEYINTSNFFNLHVTSETNNDLNAAQGGYDNVSIYIPIATPNARTMAKLAALEASSATGDRNLFHYL